MSKSRNVWGYWECPQCQTLIRGDNRTCPNCGSPIPNGQKYLPPDHPKVKEAIGHGRAVDEYKEYVPKELESNDPNWTCGYCGYQNKDKDKNCKGCGSPRYESKEDYFGHQVKLSAKEQDWKDKTTTQTRKLSQPHNTNRLKRANTKVNNDRAGYVNTANSINNGSKDYMADPCNRNDLTNRLNKRFKKGYTLKGIFNKNTIIAVVSILLIAALIWIFFPVTKEYTIKGFSWERNIEVEQYTLCHENNWSVPPGGEITSTRREIHHYDHVIDHYETKSRQVSERVLDGYDTSYRDNGNGQFTEIQTPRYRTEYRTEYYEEPVYRDEPVYRTKYYYDIDRWLYAGTLTSSGKDHEPMWPESELPNKVSNPKYGDQKLGTRTEKYYATMVSKKGKERTFSYDLEAWQDLVIGETIVHKGFRFD